MMLDGLCQEQFSRSLISTSEQLNLRNKLEIQRGMEMMEAKGS